MYNHYSDRKSRNAGNEIYYTIEIAIIFASMKNSIKTIAFDADDTLWVNEPYFRDGEAELQEIVAPYVSGDQLIRELYAVEMRNMEAYGYGIKAFVLSMIETALKVSDNKIPQADIARIVELGKRQIERPVGLLDGVEDVLAALQGRYRLVMATKGDILDQRRKLTKSGLERYFHHIEVMCDKQQDDYTRMFRRLGCAPEEVLMVGNSLKSDVLPVLELGGWGAYVPFHVTWEHEVVNEDIEHPRYMRLEKLGDIFGYLD